MMNSYLRKDRRKKKPREPKFTIHGSKPTDHVDQLASVFKIRRAMIDGDILPQGKE
jgi:hypothetical protein